MSQEMTSSSILMILLKSSSLSVHGYKLWYRRTLDEAPSADPACVFSPVHTRILISGLRPSTLYTVSVLPFSENGDHLPGSQAEFSTEKSSHSTAPLLPSGFRIRHLPDSHNKLSAEKSSHSTSPLLSCRHLVDEGVEEAKGLPDLNGPAPNESGSSVGGGGRGEAGPGWLDEGFEQCVRVVRGLEKGGSISPGFRMKMLTWLGLWSTEAERTVVKMFMRALADDPDSMAGQLTHLFATVVASGGRTLE